VARYLLILLGGVLMASCSSPKQEDPNATLRPPTETGVTASEMAQRSQAPQDQVKTLLDMDEYPGSTVVENSRLTSASFSPDEARFELVRKTEDAPDKVVKFYEEKLEAKANGSAEKREIFGRTPKGNSVRALIEADGAGSKITLVVISFMK
jgi:hypothetical protein